MERDLFSITVSGTDQSNTAATSSFTSDAIEFTSNGYWSLNVWFTSLTFTGGKPPQVTIEVSNDDDTNSFSPINIAMGVNSPVFIESEMSKWRYFRVVYDPQNATGGTKFFDLIIENV